MLLANLVKSLAVSSADLCEESDIPCCTVKYSPSNSAASLLEYPNSASPFDDIPTVLANFPIPNAFIAVAKVIIDADNSVNLTPVNAVSCCNP